MNANFFDTIEAPAPTSTVLARVKYLVELSHKSQAKFAAMINLDPSTMSRLLSGKMPITDQFMNRLVVNLGVSKDWLANGNGVPFSRAAEVPGIGDGSPAVMAIEPKGAPVYDIEATCGPVSNANMFANENILGYVDLPNINPGNPIIRVSGDSMSPRIPHGAYISIRQINDPSIIVWGQTYMVLLEDYRLVKVIRPCPGHPDKVILHSDNTAYDDMEINRNSIIKLFIVEAVLNYDFIA